MKGYISYSMLVFYRKDSVRMCSFGQKVSKHKNMQTKVAEQMKLSMLD